MPHNGTNFLLKANRRFYTWQDDKVTMTYNGSNNTINLKRFVTLAAIKGDIAACLGSRHNTSVGSMISSYNALCALETFLTKSGIAISGAGDLTTEVLSAYVAMLRSDPGQVNITSTSVTNAVFGCVRIFYKWCLGQMKPGYDKGVAAWLETVKLQQHKRNRRLKEMNPDNGPFVALEMATLDRFGTAQLNRWDALDNTARCATLTYWLTRETSRRSEELAALDAHDLLFEDGLAYLMIAGRKPTDTRARAKGKHRISNSLHVALKRYIDETEEMRESSSCNALLIMSRYGKSRRWPPGSLMAATTIMIDGANLPNRRFFSSDLPAIELDRPENGEYRLHYTASRGRLSYGTHQALAKVPFEYLSVRMGHYNVRTTLEFYVTMTPENTSEALSDAVGVKYARFAEYFFGVPSKAVEGEPVAALCDPEGLVFGGCKAGWCGHDPRIGCYLCDRFRPIVSPEHSRNLAWLKAKREAMVETVSAAGGEPDEASLGYYLAQLDLAIAGASHIAGFSQTKEQQ